MMVAKIAITIPIEIVQEPQFSLVFLQEMGQSPVVHFLLDIGERR